MPMAWNLKRAKYTEIDAEYRAFKEYYTKQLKTMYTDTHKKHVAQQAEDTAWDRLSARIEDLEAQQEFLTAVQSVSDTPTTISVPSGDLTETSSIETITNAVIAALVKSGNICNSVNSNNPPKSNRPTWRKVQYYCYTHGANVSHASKDCKTPLGDHANKPNATRCDPQGGCTRNIDKWNYWMHKGQYRKDKPN